MKIGNIGLVFFLVLVLTYSQGIGQEITEASQRIHRAFNSEETEIAKYLNHDTIALVIEHSLDTIVEHKQLMNEHKLGYFNNPKEYDDYYFRGKSGNFKVQDSRVIFEVSLKHTHYFIKELHFNDDEVPQLTKIILLDGD
ncbi:MAG: hypothetical protein MRY83_14675 [Flavobacteriales bacterium]|nr:hypothetical protein [Flavobacteriales bacterium]